MHLREAQIHSSVDRIRPARDHDLRLGVEPDPLRTVDRVIAEDRLLPPAERVEGQRDRDRHVDPHHPDLDLVLELPRRAAPPPAPPAPSPRPPAAPPPAPTHPHAPPPPPPRPPPPAGLTPPASPLPPRPPPLPGGRAPPPPAALRHSGHPPLAPHTPHI